MNLFFSEALPGNADMQIFQLHQDAKYCRAKQVAQEDVWRDMGDLILRVEGYGYAELASVLRRRGEEAEARLLEIIEVGCAFTKAAWQLEDGIRAGTPLATE